MIGGSLGPLVGGVLLAAASRGARCSSSPCRSCSSCSSRPGPAVLPEYRDPDPGALDLLKRRPLRRPPILLFVLGLKRSPAGRSTSPAAALVAGRAPAPPSSSASGVSPTPCSTSRCSRAGAARDAADHAARRRVWAACSWSSRSTCSWWPTCAAGRRPATVPGRRDAVGVMAGPTSPRGCVPPPDGGGLARPPRLGAVAFAAGGPPWLVVASPSPCGHGPAGGLGVGPVSARRRPSRRGPRRRSRRPGGARDGGRLAGSAASPSPSTGCSCRPTFPPGAGQPGGRPRARRPRARRGPGGVRGRARHHRRGVRGAPRGRGRARRRLAAARPGGRRPPAECAPV